MGNAGPQRTALPQAPGELLPAPPSIQGILGIPPQLMATSVQSLLWSLHGFSLKGVLFPLFLSVVCSGDQASLESAL